jgi:DNA-binding NarL/FixJ family response regulator
MGSVAGTLRWFRVGTERWNAGEPMSGENDVRVGGGDAKTIKLAIVEDHRAIADGLAALLNATDDVEVVGVVPDTESASRLIGETAPTVVLCDIMLDGTDAGFDLLRRYGGSSRFIMFTAFDLPAHHVRALTEGAHGFLSKTADTGAVLRAIRKVAAGGQWFSTQVLNSARRAAPQPSARERQLLTLLVEGSSNGEIAEILGLRVKTVEGMVSRLLTRYGVDSRTQLARIATREGWLT